MYSAATAMKNKLMTFMMKGSVVGVFWNKIRVLDGTDVELQRRCPKFEREVVVVVK